MSRQPFPRVLVGCPTHELKADSIDEYVKGIEALTYPNFDIFIEDNSPTPEYTNLLNEKFAAWKKNNPERNVTIVHSENSLASGRERLVNGRNLLREYFLKNNYDYLLSLEQDVVLPQNGIQQLLAHQKDIVSGTYLNQQTREDRKHLVIMAGKKIEKNATDLVASLGFLELFPSRLIPITYCGLGCTLISKKVLEKIVFRFDSQKLASDDIYFAKDALSEGFTLFLDSGLLCKHNFNDAFKKTKY